MSSKQAFYVNNPSSDLIRIPELNVSIPGGIHNLFDLRDDLTYERIQHCATLGTLRAAIDNGLCYLVPDPSNQQSFSNDVLIRMPLQVQIHSSRVRFTSVKNADTTFFSTDESNLFAEDDVKPARQLEEEMKTTTNDTQAIEATIKEAGLTDKPFEGRYTPPVYKPTPDEQKKMKKDAMLGWVTCCGMTATGKRCLKQAKKGKRFCGQHADQGK
jgi:hypothetical protein